MDEIFGYINTKQHHLLTPGEPLVSVIIPCYNQAHFLPEAVESVANQTFTDWECIIVNDGSPDNTSETARQLIANYSDKQIRLVEKGMVVYLTLEMWGLKTLKENIFCRWMQTI